MEGGTDYETYLRIHDLLELQVPLTAGAHDEMLFVVVHQAYELWFKLMLHELAAARDALLAGRPHAALPPLRRVRAVEDVLLAQLGVLETMSPDGFLEFRDPLAPASGFQSAQFREIEALSGGGDIAHLESPHFRPQARERLAARHSDPNLWDAFCVAAAALGLPMSGDRGERMAALAALYHDHSAPMVAALHQVAEALLDHDAAIAQWRFRHVLLAARQIGDRSGTGGSAGVPYLQSTLAGRFYPELWEVRSRL